MSIVSGRNGAKPFVSVEGENNTGKNNPVYSFFFVIEICIPSGYTTTNVLIIFCILEIRKLRNAGR